MSAHRHFGVIAPSHIVRLAQRRPLGRARDDSDVFSHRLMDRRLSVGRSQSFLSPVVAHTSKSKSSSVYRRSSTVVAMLTTSSRGVCYGCGSAVSKGLGSAV